MRNVMISLLLVIFFLFIISPLSAQEGTKKWDFQTGGDINSSPALGSDGTIYVGSTDGNLYAINSDDGTKKWSFQTGEIFFSSPAIDPDGTIYIGTSISEGKGELYAINPDSTEKWVYDMVWPVNISPAIGSDGTIYVNSSVDNKLYALKPSNGEPEWVCEGIGTYFFSSPAIGSDGTIYVGSEEGNLYAINPDDGTIKWSSSLAAISSSPAIGSDGTIYVGSGNNNLYAINPDDGSEKWVFETGGDIMSSPAIASDGTIYVGSQDYNLYAVDPDGNEVGSYKTTYVIFSSPAIGSDGTVYVGSGDSHLYAFKPDLTDKKWAFKTGDGIISSPAIDSDGTIYIGSSDNRFYAINGNSNGLADTPWPMYNNNLRHTGRAGEVNDVYSSGGSKVPDKYTLEQNYPNPFNPTTTIKYSLPKKSNVKITIYNINGKKVKTLTNTSQEPGYHEIKWNASEMSSGVYFYQLKANDFIDVNKSILIK